MSSDREPYLQNTSENWSTVLGDVTLGKALLFLIVQLALLLDGQCGLCRSEPREINEGWLSFIIMI
jgi:hypothetical protein